MMRGQPPPPTYFFLEPPLVLYCIVSRMTMSYDSITSDFRSGAIDGTTGYRSIPTCEAEYAKHTLHTLLLDPLIKFHCHINYTVLVQFLSPKMHQIQNFLWLRLEPHWGSYSAPPDPLASGREDQEPLPALGPLDLKRLALSKPTFYSMAPPVSGASRNNV